MNRERERWRVVAEVHQTLGDVVLVDARMLFDLAAFENQLVTDAAGGTGVDDAVCIFQFGCQIVCIQDGCLGDRFQSFRAQHADVSVGNRQDTGTTIRSRSDGVQVASP